MYTFETPQNASFGNNRKRSLNKLQNPNNARFLESVQEKIFQHFDESSYTVTQLAKDLNLSRTHLFRKIKNILGISVCGYICLLRLTEAKKLLKSRQYTISEVAYQVGFSDPAYFSRQFSKFYGYPPSEEWEKCSF